MAVVQEMLKSRSGDADKHATIIDYDRVLGLSLDTVDKPEELPQEIKILMAERQAARDAKDWVASDRLRDAIQDLGYLIQDTKEGMQVIKK
jgi:cysteinyl-tRNA synthetase